MGKILIVDNDKHILDLFALEISESGHEVIKSRSCSGLRMIIKKHQPDAVILDMKPDDSYSLNKLQEIFEYNPDLPVIIWSSYEAYMYDMKRIVADNLIPKSCDLTELKLKIQHVLGKDSILLPSELSLIALRSNNGWKRIAAKV